MPRGGHNKKPASLRIFEGNPGHRGIPAEVAAQVKAPPRPKWLTGEARKMWNEIVPELLNLGLVAKIDKGTLAGLCELWGEFVHIGELMEANKHDTEESRKLSARRRQVFHEYRIAAAEFGLSPSARARLAPDTLTGSSGKSVDEFAAMKGL